MDSDRNSAASTLNSPEHEFKTCDNINDEKPSFPSEEPETRCGLWSCRPKFIQKCNNPKCLLMFLSFFSLAQGFVINGINNVSTTSFERRFQLPSSRVGIISSSYDFSAAILGIFVSFLGSGRQKAKWLSCACLTMSVGSFVMALPHFTSGKYEWGQNIDLYCSSEDNLSVSCQADEKLQNYLYVLILGELLHGLGGTTLYTVGVSLIDDSVSESSSPMFIGIMYVFSALGTALGYVIGGQLLEIFVDFDTVAASEITMTTEDPRWVGAWWIGFVIASGLFIIAAIPIALFGAELPTAKHVRETRVSQVHGDDGKMPVVVAAGNRKMKDLRRLPAEILQLLKTPPFLFVTLAGTMEGLTISGLATFVPKFIQNQLSVSAGWAAMLTGFITVPGAAGGHFFGGYICKRLRLKVRDSLRVAIICSGLSLFAVSALWARCNYDNIAGITSMYTNSSVMTLPQLTSDCNRDCQCNTVFYKPVCDSHGIQYFSPCHAGCKFQADNYRSYNSCSCVAPSPGTNISMVNVGKCDDNCKLLYVFMPLMFIAVFLIFIPSQPAIAVTLRCIHDNQRTLGQGLKWCIVRLLGTVPGPILFGVAIDNTCILWREKCGEYSSCWIYNNYALSRNFFIIFVCFKLATVTCFILAYKLYKPPAEKDVIYYKAETSVTASTPNVYTIRYCTDDGATTNERSENTCMSASVQSGRWLSHL